MFLVWLHRPKCGECCRVVQVNETVVFDLHRPLLLSVQGGEPPAPKANLRKTIGQDCPKQHLPFSSSLTKKRVLGWGLEDKILFKKVLFDYMESVQLKPLTLYCIG